MAISVLENKYYLELTMKADASTAYMQDSRKRPLVRCDSESVSRKVNVIKLTLRKSDNNQNVNGHAKQISFELCFSLYFHHYACRWHNKSTTPRTCSMRSSTHYPLLEFLGLRHCPRYRRNSAHLTIV